MNDLEATIANLLVFLALWLLAAAIYTHYLKKSKLISQAAGL